MGDWVLPCGYLYLLWFRGERFGIESVDFAGGGAEILRREAGNDTSDFLSWPSFGRDSVPERKGSDRKGRIDLRNQRKLQAGRRKKEGCVKDRVIGRSTMFLCTVSAVPR